MTGIHDTIGDDLVNHCVNDILVQGAAAAVLPRLPGDRAARSRRGRADRRRARRAPAARTAARCSAARPPRCRGSTPTASTTSPASSSASVERERLIDGTAHRAGRRADRRCRRPACTPTATRWRGTIVFERLQLGVHDRGPGARRDGRRGAARAAPLVPAARPPAARRRGLHQGHGAHHRRRASPTTCRACCRRHRGGRAHRSPGTCRRSSRGSSAPARVPHEDMLRTFNMGIGLILVVPETRPQAELLDAGERDARVVGESSRRTRVVS